MNDAQQAALMVQLHAQKAQLQQKNKEIAEKDLEIKKLQTEIEEYEIALDLAAKRDGNHAKITLSATADNERLRRALQEAKKGFERIGERSIMAQDDADEMGYRYALSDVIRIANKAFQALGEGDKQ